MKLFVRNLTGTMDIYYLEDGTQTTAATLKSKIEERRGIPVEKFHLKWNGKTLEGESALERWGIGDENVVHVCGRLLGGSAIAFEFSTLQDGKERGFVDNAPEHRIIEPGLNLEGKCVNEKCKAYGKSVWSNMGFKSAGQTAGHMDGMVGFNMGAVIHTAPCPLCHAYLESLSVLSCGFYKCEYEYEGYELGKAGMFRGKNRVAKADGFEYHDGKVNKKSWTHLIIAVKPLN